MRSKRVLRIAVLLAVLLAASTMTGIVKAGVADAEAHVAAVWQPQIVKFEYRAGSTLYTCRSLQRKVERILLQVGARERARFRRFYCGELSHIVSAEIAVMTPLEATDENLRRLTDYDSREILVARVQGQRLPGAAELQVFPAAWRRMTLPGMRFGHGDCDLLQQLRQQVLPKLSVRVVSSNLEQCSTVLGKGVAPHLVVQALIAEPVDRVVEAR
jgi:hypothetical protein